jgi:hypothetical protein
VLTLAVVLGRLSWQLPVTVGLERALYDVRAGLTAPRVDQDDRVVLVVFTEDTIRNTGKRSPLDRALLGRALANLDRLNPKSIGVDILIDSAQADDESFLADIATLKTPTFFAFSTITDNGEQVMTYQEEYMRGLFSRLQGSSVRPASIRLDVDGLAFLDLLRRVDREELKRAAGILRLWRVHLPVDVGDCLQERRFLQASTLCGLLCHTLGVASQSDAGISSSFRQYGRCKILCVGCTRLHLSCRDGGGGFGGDDSLGLAHDGLPLLAFGSGL